MAAIWKINNLIYHLNKVDGKDKVVYKTNYKVTDSKTVGDDTYKGMYVGSIIHDLEIVEAVEAKDAVLYTNKDTILEDKAVKVGDVKTPAVAEVKGKSPWSDADFVAYNDLKEDVVLGWVKSNLGDDKVKEIEDDVALQISNQENPPAPVEESGLPW